MKRVEDRLKTDGETEPARQDHRPEYAPPRIEKKRSVSRATLFTGGGPGGGTEPPPLVGQG